ncbi:hypothetical protein [Azospirillum sp. sgz302134]
MTTTNDTSAGALETTADAGKGPAGIVARWLMEIRLAGKEEEPWRKLAADAVKRYRDEEQAGRGEQQGRKLGTRFNILRSNIETLAPALYNSVPKPDVRRRYGDADPLGRAIAEMLERALAFDLEQTDFDGDMQRAVMDRLLPGRGVTRVRYVPTFTRVPRNQFGQQETQTDEAKPRLSMLAGEGQAAPRITDAAKKMVDDAPRLSTSAGQPMSQPPLISASAGDEPEPQPEGGQDGEFFEDLAWESAPTEHVQWKDFRRGPGRTWQDVCWIAFRAYITREEAVERFGDDIAAGIELDVTPEGLEEGKGSKDDGGPPPDVFKRLTVWEVWDKESRQVLYIAPSYKDAPLKVEADPLGLTGFFPIPRPLYALEQTDTLVPVEDYRAYRDQAEELDRITGRITTIINGLKLRGVYDSTVGEISEVMAGNDNALIPTANTAVFRDAGGLEKAVWFWPVETAAKVLTALYQQREAVKQTIYEITGISDILRGSTAASETATAQNIKAQWGSLRLQRAQREVQRYARDLLRLKAEIIAEHFGAQTLTLMTGVQVTPEMMAVLKNDAFRSFRVDVETDSTIAADMTQAQEAAGKWLLGVSQYFQAIGPAVQSGDVPRDAAVKILAGLSRMFKLPREVNDALESLEKQPVQQGDPNAAAQAQAQQQQAQMQADMQAKAMELQARTQADMQRAQLEADLKWRIAELDSQTKIQVALINAHADQQNQAMRAQLEHERGTQAQQAEQQAAAQQQVTQP